MKSVIDEAKEELSACGVSVEELPSDCEVSGFNPDEIVMADPGGATMGPANISGQICGCNTNYCL